MSLNSQKILGVEITTSPKEIILEYINKYLFSSSNDISRSARFASKALIIFTPNSEQIVLAQKNIVFFDTINRADIALPDGIGIAIAVKFLCRKYQESGKNRNIERIPGVEFMGDLVRIGVDRGVSIGLIGGYDGLAVRTLECLQAQHSVLTGWATDGPILPANNDIPPKAIREVSDKIEKQKTSIVFAGFGAPKQEFFLEALKKELVRRAYRRPIVLMAVGGSFDIITGKLKRAPLLIRLIGFEWAWRLIQEPWRWKRQLTLVKFVWLVLKEKMR